MDISKLASRCGSVSSGHVLYKMRGGYDSMMDNSCKNVDGKMYKIFHRVEDNLLAEDLKEGDIDYAMLIWADFANSRNIDNVRLEDRNI